MQYDKFKSKMNANMSKMKTIAILIIISKKAILVMNFLFLFISCNNEIQTPSDKPIHDKLSNVVASWNDAINSKNIDEITTFYSHNILFYGVPKSRASVLESKIQFFKKYPDFNQSIDSEIKIDFISDSQYKIEFVKKSFFNGRNSEVNAYLVLKLENEKWKIVNEGDIITDEKLASGKSSEDNSFQNHENFLIYGLSNSEMIPDTLFNNWDFETEYVTKNVGTRYKPILKIAFEPQTIITIRGSAVGSDHYSSPLFIVDNMDKPASDEQEVELETYHLNIGEHDFDSDGINEIVIAYGKRGEYLQCRVIKFHEPSNLADIGREENWPTVGDFPEHLYHDPRYISYVEKNIINFPIGSQGVSESFAFIKDKFIEF